MKVIHLIMVLLYAVAMGIGQILFKNVAVRAANLDASFARKMIFFATDITFIGSLLLYGALTVLWIWILGFVPLSRAYPYTFMSIVVAGLGGRAFYGEALGANFFWGAGLISIGLLVISME